MTLAHHGSPLTTSFHPLTPVPYDQVSFSCLDTQPNEDVRHEAGIKIDSLDSLIHRFPDGPESADLSVDSLEMMD